jgi:DDE superfamily endonuclease
MMGLGPRTHESPELMKYCIEQNIVLIRIGSHTSDKTQPLDVAVFGPLKIAYRELIGLRNRRGVHNIGKQYFTLLHDQARQVAFTQRTSSLAGLRLDCSRSIRLEFWTPFEDHR